jgi:hypothetical protein
MNESHLVHVIKQPLALITYIHLCFTATITVFITCIMFPFQGFPCLRNLQYIMHKILPGGGNKRTREHTHLHMYISTFLFFLPYLNLNLNFLFKVQ